MSEALAAGPVPGAGADQNGALALSGRLTINEAERVRDELLRALAGCGRLSLNTADLETVDAAGLQLLIAARRSAGLAGKSLRLVPAPAGALLAALVAAGFRPAGGEGRPDGQPDVNQDGFWWGRS